ncbi:hypothetical protein BJX63DRAFT_421598 [Aspergillus granulosus]|uniref:Sensor histidine kinase/response regulator n=1 Tax=Aspergillus granulosus TaxID=176169 RepID=A0ABR4HBW9_9EURO
MAPNYVSRPHHLHTECPALAKASAPTQQAGEPDVIDSILSALTQLGAFRLGCCRAFTAIFERDTPRVIAEATTSSSTADNRCHEPDSLIGAATLGLERRNDGDTNIAGPDGYRVIWDTREKDVDLQKQPLLERSQARFYAEIPLRDFSGNLIGTYGVLDSNPHPSFDIHNLAVLYRVAESIAEHLDNVLARQRDACSKRKLEALLAIAKGQNEFQATDWDPRKSISTSGSVSPRSSVPSLDGLNLSHTTGQSPASSLNTTPVATFLQTSPSEGGETSSEAYKRHIRRSSGGMKSMVVVPEARSIHPHITSVYEKASSLLQASMDLDGVMFVNAPRVGSRSNSRRFVTYCSALHNAQLTHNRSSCVSFSAIEGNAGSADSNRRSSSKLCDSLSCAFSEWYSTNGKMKPPITMDEGLLHELFKAFPHGQAFDPIQAINIADPIYRAVVNALFQAFPDASSLGFVPLWDSAKTKWVAAAIVWSCRPHREFKDDDLDYLRTSSNLIVSEVAQIDRSAVEKSKSDLLSSMSHELRSPLHGMLANSELLQSTDLDPAQRDMVRMIETCGETLLDTMNCLLDFAKINNLTRAHKGSISTATHLNSLSTKFDLGSLVEDVASSVYAGHRRLSEAKSAGCHQTEGELNEKDMGYEKKTNDLTVVVRVEDHTDWNIRSISGAWRRIVMNVLGNSLKFTRSGLIEVSVDRKQRKGDGRASNFACLTISDTGCGISQEYLNSKLFTPFSQQSVLTEGVGLGLSITQQLVEYLGGYIQVESELGAGTQVAVYVPVDFVETNSPTHNLDQGADIAVHLRVCLIGLDPHLDASEGGQCLSSDAKRKLAIRNMINGLVLQQPGWKLSFADSLGTASGDVVVLDQSALGIPGGIKAFKPKSGCAVILGDYGVTSPQTGNIDGIEVIYISQPFGPHKLMQALQSLAASQSVTISDDCGPIVSPIPAMPMQDDSFPSPFGVPKGLDSPPAVRHSVSDNAPSSPEGMSENPLYILIVDDNDINLKILSTFMWKMGCTFETASDGLSALQKYKQSTRKFDYVLMDISMPIMDGITASSRIREYEEEYELPRTTIMAVTGIASSETQEQAFAAGIDDYLVKPLSLRDLKRILNVP